MVCCCFSCIFLKFMYPSCSLGQSLMHPHGKLTARLARKWMQPISKCDRNFSLSRQCLGSSSEEIKIPVPWGHVAGRWWNRGKSDPVLAVHGWLGNAATFDRLVPLLSKDVSVLAIDLPGFGLSSPLAAGCYYHRFSSVVLIRKMVVHFNWEKFSLLGHAMGGSITFLYSCLFPETIKSLSIIDAPMTPIPIDEGKYVEAAGALIDKFLERDYNQASGEGRGVFTKNEATELISVLFEDKLSSETVHKIMERNIRCEGDNQCYFIHDKRLKDSRLSGWNQKEILKLAESIKTHVLVIKYDKSPFYMPQEDFYKSWDAIKAHALSASLHTVKGRRHDLLENPQLASVLLNDHLQKYHLANTEKR